MSQIPPLVRVSIFASAYPATRDVMHMTDSQHVPEQCGTRCSSRRGLIGQSYFTLTGSDYPTRQAQEAAIARYIRWRNKHAQPKRHFAIGSKIRHPDYLPLSA